MKLGSGSARADEESKTGAGGERRGPTRIALIGLLAVTGALFVPQAAAAADWTVNDDMTGPGPAGADCADPDFSSLQDAEDGIDVDPGDRILVCAGTYVGVEDETGLIWKGAQTGVDARSRDVPDSEESLVDPEDDGFRLFANDITVDGFKIEDADDGVDMDEDTSDHRIVNNIITNSGDGVQAESDGEAGGTAIKRNGFRDTEDGIHSDDVLVNVEIEENSFNEHDVAIVLHPEFALSDVEIRGNEVSEAFGGIVLLGGADVEVTDNALNQFFAAIVLEGGNEEIGIERNTIDGAPPPEIVAATTVPGSAGIIFTMEVDENNEQVDMIANTITGNAVGILAEDAATGGGIEAHFNRFAGNGGELFVEGVDGDSSGAIVNENDLEQIDAENNWFGCNEGPLAPDAPEPNDCDIVEGNVDTDPWLVLDVKSKTSQVKPNQSTKVRASLNQNSDDEDLVPCLFPRGTEIDFTSTKKGEVDPESDGTNRDCKAKTKFFAGPTEGKAKVRALLDEERVKDVVRIRRP